MECLTCGKPSRAATDGANTAEQAVRPGSPALVPIAGQIAPAYTLIYCNGCPANWIGAALQNIGIEQPCEVYRVSQ